MKLVRGRIIAAMLVVAIALVGYCSYDLLAQSSNTVVTTPTGDMINARQGHKVIMLNDGRALIGGGESKKTAEFYDSSTSQFTKVAGEYTSGRSMCMQMHLLPDGKVFLLPFGSTGEIFDPVAETYTSIGTPTDFPEEAG